MRLNQRDYKILVKAYAKQMNYLARELNVPCAAMVDLKHIVPLDVWLAGYFHARLKDGYEQKAAQNAIEGSHSDRMKKIAIGELIYLMKLVGNEKMELESTIADELAELEAEEYNIGGWA